MKTKRQIMSEAHQIAKTFEGDYAACLSEALRISWQNAKDNFTPDFIRTAGVKLEDMPVKAIFEILSDGYDFLTKDYSNLASDVLLVVAKNSAGFQKDIAGKAFYENRMMTQKQAWCVAYEYKNIA